MRESLEWLVGGQQGEGVDSTGELFAKTLVRSGYSVSTYKQFMSRIKGGHTNYKIKATPERNYYSGDGIDILLCLDKETLTNHEQHLKSGAVVIQEGKEIVVSSEQSENGTVYTLFTVPLKKIAKDLGNPMAKNMIALGISAALAELHVDILHDFIGDIFAKKGAEVITSNKQAVLKGYELTNEHIHDRISGLAAPVEGENLFISGNEATAFGSLMAGCRFLSAYPITPASEVMEWLSDELPKVGGTVMQVEDEIAGICFAVGASYSGVRAMTSTSGPGLSLKTEALGMAGMSEIPIVIVNSQRGGPSTGLPTKHEQSDLQQMVYGTHGEIPRIVLSPATIEDAFYIAAEAFNLADVYQCPVIVALDLGLSMNKMTVPAFNTSKVKIDRGKLISEEEAEAFNETHFKRYRFTDDGISPRPLPGMKYAVHTTSSNEHDESGYISEDPENRTNMMKKRLGKVKEAIIQEPFKLSGDTELAEVVFVGMGSTYGMIQEAVEQLNSEGVLKATHLHIQQLFPLPLEKLEPLLQGKRVVTIENNYNAQLLQLLKQHLPIHANAQSITQFNGNPFTVHKIVKEVKELISWQR
ncbi:2-oxoacid:acceptor oxidoreductase subunit alpha [Evansella cellulosilytica]|uniref:Pyruvate flavodoxin/ferredoxin oxidoreductase domain protein n=1 Tax=Evansella cellulosilytica (strain ATCC 21833 / DSM 2522 / FERM P-1141 / JCM 9156 / N-4) TaxID=649639 RepID=E6U046_EVAC2|nr:2-oxoacid:acceptor oxidoreductase subunit alpha [Evansella cellulosilytica]ADU29050.1 pyruvate flavodoxin/ferredoxin oxidoreductase domain protein [Evansella cellulosilytica DSM 2522]